jgi:hypothetical protein
MAPTVNGAPATGKRKAQDSGDHGLLAGCSVRLAPNTWEAQPLQQVRLQAALHAGAFGQPPLPTQGSRPAA